MKYVWIVYLFIIPFGLFATSYNATVIRVVDGDTVILDWDNNEERVRIVGIDTPEIVASNRPVECFGQEASNYAKQLLPEQSTVVFEYDNERDKYDRALGYITLSDNRDFGLTMISDGYAYAYRSYDHSRMTSYTTAESVARLNSHGLWAPNACRTSPQSVDQTVSAWEQYASFVNTIIKYIINLVS